MEVLFRKIKAKLTGNYPCTYETRSGHNIVLLENHKVSWQRKYHCPHCGVVMRPDEYFGFTICPSDNKHMVNGWYRS